MMLDYSLDLLSLKPSVKVCCYLWEGKGRAALRTSEAAGKLDAGRVWDQQCPDGLRNSG